MAATAAWEGGRGEGGEEGGLPRDIATPGRISARISARIPHRISVHCGPRLLFQRAHSANSVGQQIADRRFRPCLAGAFAAPRTTGLIEARLDPARISCGSLAQLSTRSRKPFVALNCAAIPEALLEAELFGHTRGAFTGAVQGRVGRIEAADGGTVFLDEIGEMPLALQSKLLRFVECGELQRVGENATVKVDVRIIAATHQPLAQHAQAGGFRADLYYRLAVFLVRTPALVEHLEDLTLLVDHFLARLGRARPVKRIDESAIAKLKSHAWPGNVRELEHVLERAAILAGDEPILTADDIDFGMPMISADGEKRAS